MRLGRVGLAIATSCIGVMFPAESQTPFERQIFEQLNEARTRPAAYAKALRTYRTYFRGNMLRYPQQTADLETEEGVAAVDEAIAVLTGQAPLAPVANAPLLALVAADHVADQAKSGDVGHDGSDGGGPGDRATRRGGGAFVAEVIAYGPVDAVDVVRQLIVDDGVADRGHRGILYSPELRFAGIACGSHPEFRTMCVIDLSITPDGRYPEAPARP